MDLLADIAKFYVLGGVLFMGIMYLVVRKHLCDEGLKVEIAITLLSFLLWPYHFLFLTFEIIKDIWETRL